MFITSDWTPNTCDLILLVLGKPWSMHGGTAGNVENNFVHIKQ